MPVGTKRCSRIEREGCRRGKSEDCVVVGREGGIVRRLLGIDNLLVDFERSSGAFLRRCIRAASSKWSRRVEQRVDIIDDAIEFRAAYCRVRRSAARIGWLRSYPTTVPGNGRILSRIEKGGSMAAVSSEHPVAGAYVFDYLWAMSDKEIEKLARETRMLDEATPHEYVGYMIGVNTKHLLRELRLIKWLLSLIAIVLLIMAHHYLPANWWYSWA